jgi:hypothetical protein
MGEKRNANDILTGNPEGKKPLGKPRRRCDDNIKTDLREAAWGVVDWIHLASDGGQWRAVVKMVMNLSFHKM